MGERRTVVVTGATGRQDGSVARLLLRYGWRVRAVTGIRKVVPQNRLKRSASKS